MKNGLYSIHVTLLDGRVGKGSGVIMFRDGQILGGDAYLFYTGSYTVKDDTFKGEVLVQRHTTPAHNENPLFGGPEPGRDRRFRHLHRYPRRDERHRAGRQGQPDFWRHAAKLAEADDRSDLSPFHGNPGELLIIAICCAVELFRGVLQRRDLR